MKIGCKKCIYGEKGLLTESDKYGKKINKAMRKRKRL